LPETPTDQPILAHGLGHDLVPPDWPPLTLGEVDAVLRHYPGIDGATGLEWHSPRPFSAASIVTSPAGPLFVKRHHRKIRTVAALAEEHGFMAHLAARGIPVAEVLTTETGASALAAGDWVYEVHQIGTGADLYRDALSWSPFQSPAHAAAAGRALADLHKAAADYHAPARQPGILVSSFGILTGPDPLTGLGAYVAARPGLAAYLAARDWRTEIAAAIAPFHRDLVPRLDQLPPLWTHNDWHGSNLLWGPTDGVTGILDFGLADRTAALHDLATAIERNAVAWLDLETGRGDLVDWAGLDSLLAGYESVTTLGPDARAALPALLPIVHLEFALTEIDYFFTVLDSAEKADLAYDSYLLGHTEWFHGREGRALLDHLNPRGR
jgi:Ser/Thr protein kinase RdoA (MazF antagonist)